jgi:hypothetical protein
MLIPLEANVDWEDQNQGPEQLSNISNALKPPLTDETKFGDRTTVSAKRRKSLYGKSTLIDQKWF